jgi:hypothetical protein
MKSQTNYIHITLSILLALVMITIVTGLAIGVLWYFNNYVEGELDPSNNVITECISKCQEEATCEEGAISRYKLVNGSCNCECVKVKVNTNTNNSTDGTNLDGISVECTTDDDCTLAYTERDYSKEMYACCAMPICVAFEDDQWVGVNKDAYNSYLEEMKSQFDCESSTCPMVEPCIQNDNDSLYEAKCVEDVCEKVDESSLTDWQTYTHTNFTLQYPTGWEARADISGSALASETVTFSAPEIISDSLWSVLLYSSSSTGEDILIAKMGDQFSDRKEIRERITVGGKQANKVTVTTETITGWKHVQIFFENGSTLYAINDGARSYNEDFETFYNSFQLVNN